MKYFTGLFCNHEDELRFVAYGVAFYRCVECQTVRKNIPVSVITTKGDE